MKKILIGSIFLSALLMWGWSWASGLKVTDINKIYWVNGNSCPWWMNRELQSADMNLSGTVGSEDRPKCSLKWEVNNANNQKARILILMVPLVAAWIGLFPRYLGGYGLKFWSWIEPKKASGFEKGVLKAMFWSVASAIVMLLCAVISLL